MVMFNAIFIAMMAAAIPLAEGRNCNTGLLYCGQTLLNIGNYRAQIDAAVAKAGKTRFPGDDYTTDSLFKYVDARMEVLVEMIIAKRG
ncbi:hypothetical protein MY3296_007474 [Beauveria thailandica]